MLKRTLQLFGDQISGVLQAKSAACTHGRLASGARMKIAAVLIVGMLLASSLTDAADRCDYGENAMLALGEHAFDQDWRGTGGGWRAVASIPGCELAAADLLAAYRAKHPTSSSMLAWHEGQLRASAGQYEQAMPLLERARKPADEDFAGSNDYVDATLAFLRRDKRGLSLARERLAAVSYPEGPSMPPLKDGFFELSPQPGQPSMRMRWPPNLDVVDGLLACFDRPYSEAYALSCRPPAP